MTDFTPGAIITRESPLWDGDRPSWLREGVRILIHNAGGYWYGKYNSFHMDVGYIEQADDAIRLDASDIVYRCIDWNEAHPDEAPMWPWYGGDEAPSDWDNNAVLFRCQESWVPNGISSWNNPDLVIGYRKRRPTTSLPEPAEEKVRVVSTTGMAGASFAVEGNEFVPTYSAVETAKHYAELAGGVFVPKMTESYLRNLWEGNPSPIRGELWLAHHLGIIRPDPTPLDIAKAEHPHIKPEDVERIAAIVKGEVK